MIMHDNYWDMDTAGNFCGTLRRVPLQWPSVTNHNHEYEYSGKDAYGYIATCKSCGNVKVTPIKLGE